MKRRSNNPHDELCAWANGLREDSPVSSIDAAQQAGYRDSDYWREACRLYRARCSPEDCSRVAEMRTLIETGEFEVHRRGCNERVRLEAENKRLRAACDEYEEQCKPAAFRGDEHAGKADTQIPGGPSPPVEKEPPYYAHSFWSPCRKYIVTACVPSPGSQISLVDGDGNQWEEIGHCQDMTKQIDPEGYPKRGCNHEIGRWVNAQGICENCNKQVDPE